MFFQRKPAQTPPSPIKQFEADLTAAIRKAMDGRGRDSDWVLLSSMAADLEARAQGIRVQIACRRPL